MIGVADALAQMGIAVEVSRWYRHQDAAKVRRGMVLEKNFSLRISV
jgi:hypothetical protein